MNFFKIALAALVMVPCLTTVCASRNKKSIKRTSAHLLIRKRASQRRHSQSPKATRAKSGKTAQSRFVTAKSPTVRQQPRVNRSSQGNTGSNSQRSYATQPQRTPARPAPSNQAHIAAQPYQVAIRSFNGNGEWGPHFANHLYFYESGKPYYEFTNFYARPIEVDGKTWPTTEHYFQAQKFVGNAALREKIRRLSTAREAFQEARDPKNAQYIDPQWQSKKLAVMERAVHAKFTQHADLRSMLKRTGNKILVENAGANDADWGAGADYKGKNNLGIILMKVRRTL